MKPGFALSLSAEGIVLLHRAAGGWRNVGTVALDSADIATELASLKARGELLEPDGRCKLIIPNDQIRYLTIETGISDLESRRRLALAALEGATPYAVSDLAFDLSEDGSKTHIAAVAYETLAEAESFALENGFIPASFVATPGESGFLGEPFFGPAPSLGDIEIIPDGIAVVDVGPAEVKAETTPEPTPLTPPPDPSAGSAKTAASLTVPAAPVGLQPETPAEPVSEGAPIENDGPVAGFSSRRRKTPTPSPVSAPTPKATLAPATAQSGPMDTGAVAVAPRPDARPNTGSKPVQNPIKNSAQPASTGIKPTIALEDTAILAAAVKSPSKTSSDKIPSAPKLAPSTVVPTISGDGAKALGSSTATTAATAPTGSLASSGPSVSGPAAKSTRRPAKPTAATTAKGKPRFLGLILTAVLLLTMVAVAAFAMLSEGGLFFSSERPPLEHSEDAPLDEPTAPASDPVEIGPTQVMPSAPLPGSAVSDGNGPSLVETEPDSIAPQVSAIPGQPDPGVIELSHLVQPNETERPFDASTGQPVLDALEGPNTELETTDPQDSSQTLSEAALYAATGIWQQVPQIAEAPALVSLDDIYIASIDNSNLSQDAVALPRSPVVSSDPTPDTQSSPAAAGSDFDLDHRGLVTATPEGTLNPDGVLIYLGRPNIVPPPTPARASPTDTTTEAENARLASLALKRPRPRPSDLLERAERALLGGLSRAELAHVRPRARPASLKTEEQENQPVSELAILTSTTPRARPVNFANLVDRATRQRTDATAPANTAAAIAAIAPQSVSPSIPSSASVARQATVTNAINLRRINLIGVSGKPSNRQALILLPSGRTRKVSIGDRLDGGTVIAISDSQLQYQKRGTNTTLKLPGD